MPDLLEKETARAQDAGSEQGGKKPLRRATGIRGRLPEKRTINLAAVNANRINWKLAAPLLLLVLAAVAAFAKFAVLDVMERADQAQREVDTLQAQIDAGYAAIDGFGEINDVYAHYTYSAMTPEELGRADRIEMMSMLKRVVLPVTPIDNWSVQGNQLVLEINGKTLQEINQLVQRLLAEDLVDYCTVTTAATNNQNGGAPSDSETVRASVVVRLRNAQQEVQS